MMKFVRSRFRSIQSQRERNDTFNRRPSIEWLALESRLRLRGLGRGSSRQIRKLAVGAAEQWANFHSHFRWSAAAAAAAISATSCSATPANPADNDSAIQTRHGAPRGHLRGPLEGPATTTTSWLSPLDPIIIRQEPVDRPLALDESLARENDSGWQLRHHRRHPHHHHHHQSADLSAGPNPTQATCCIRLLPTQQALESASRPVVSITRLFKSFFMPSQSPRGRLWAGNKLICYFLRSSAKVESLPGRTKLCKRLAGCRKTLSKRIGGRSHHLLD